MKKLNLLVQKLTLGLFFFDASYDSYLDLLNFFFIYYLEKLAMFRWYYNNLVSKYFGKSGKLFFVFGFEPNASV